MMAKKKGTLLKLAMDAKKEGETLKHEKGEARKQEMVEKDGKVNYSAFASKKKGKC